MRSKAYYLLLLAVFAAVLFPSTVQAEPRQKASVAVIFINNARTTYDEELNVKVNSWLRTKVDGIYNVIPGEPYMEKMSKAGLSTVAEAERQDLCAAFAGEDIDYAVIAELQPFIRKERITFFSYGKDMTATMYLKMLDLRNCRNLYNGKFIVRARDSTEAGLIGNKSVAFKALDIVFIQMGEAISVKLPLRPPEQSIESLAP